MAGYYIQTSVCKKSRMHAQLLQVKRSRCPGSHGWRSRRLKSAASGRQAVRQNHRSKPPEHLDLLLDKLQPDPIATNPMFRGQLLGTSSDYSSPGLARKLRSATRNEPPSRHQPLSAPSSTPVAGYRSPKPGSNYAPSVTAASSSCRLKSAATVDVADGFCCFCHESPQRFSGRQAEERQRSSAG